jgi:hypothetical protein
MGLGGVDISGRCAKAEGHGTPRPRVSGGVGRPDLETDPPYSLLAALSTVLTIGALAQVMRCSVGAAIAREIGADLILFMPAWVESRLLSYFSDRYSDGGDIVLYQRPGAETGTGLVSIGLPLAVLVVSLVVLFAMYRATRPTSAAVSRDSQRGEIQ